MESPRKPFQGVLNILRFNWHFYALSIIVIISIYLLDYYAFNSDYLKIIFGLVILTILISLFASLYIYELSGLYSFQWLSKLEGPFEIIANIHAGFDETTYLLRKKYTPTQMMIFDFYNPHTNTEISIKRARRIYPSLSETKQISATHIPIEDNFFDAIFVIFSAHEIRDPGERVRFFNELKRIVKPGGKIILTEHLRDLSNFLVYTIGAFHFYSKSSWLKIFKSTGLLVSRKIKANPFITTFILEKNGTTP